MNSTNLPINPQPVFDHDAVFYLGRTALGIGCIAELILIIFFCANVFFTSKKNDLNSAYFKITVVGYVVDVISSGILIIREFVDPAYLTTFSTISILASLYVYFHIGMLSVLMSMNRCTALVFPVLHNKIWEGYPLYIIIPLFIAAPCIIGHKYLFSPCFTDVWLPHCMLIINEYYIFTISINLPLLILTLIAICVGIWFSRKQSVSSSGFKKVERRLVWQVISSSILIIFYYLLCYFGGLFYDESPEIGNKFYSMSIVVYALHTYPSIIVLFIVSSTFRQQFTAFYGCKNTTSLNTKTTTIVASIQPKR